MAVREGQEGIVYGGGGCLVLCGLGLLFMGLTSHKPDAGAFQAGGAGCLAFGLLPILMLALRSQLGRDVSRPGRSPGQVSGGRATGGGLMGPGGPWQFEIARLHMPVFEEMRKLAPEGAYKIRVELTSEPGPSGKAAYKPHFFGEDGQAVSGLVVSPALSNRLRELADFLKKNNQPLHAMVFEGTKKPDGQWQVKVQ